MSFVDLINKIKSASDQPEDSIEKITKAYEYAKNAHEGQKRNSGEDYIIHPVAVTNILADLNMDDDTLIAGLLHDVIEDTVCSYEDLEHLFGHDVAELVDGVTKLKKITVKSKKENQAENLRKMVFAMAKDIRVVIIKLADRLHNMRTLEYMTREKQIEKATEVLEIYAPLAHRLGISTIKWELEDLSLRYLEPTIYYDLVDKIKVQRTEREKFIQDIITVLQVALAELHIPAEITGRPKSIYSIYKKMYKHKKTFDEIFDLSAVRVIVDNQTECYAALGAVHTMWKPIQGRFKDYIAVPKSNMYQSIHTTVIGPRGEIFEVQIRSWEMHKTAEYGIAAHWKYKEGTTGTQTNFDNKLTWLRQLMEWQNNLSDSREFIDAVKEELTTDEVFVFSPKGDVMDLPEGSTPIDFAYRVHSAIGNKCVGAKVNLKMVPLTYKLKTGDIVEIKTNVNSKPSRDWLKIVRSPQAKTKIRQYFKKEQKEQNIITGRDMLEKEVLKEGYTYNEILKTDWLENIQKRLSYNSIDDMYASIGYGSLKLTQVLPKLKEFHKDYYQVEEAIKNISAPPKEEARVSTAGIIVEDIDDAEVKLAKCCNPVPGDEIIGYITRGRGVSVHRADCSNIKHIEEKNRFISVRWAKNLDHDFSVSIRLVAFDRPGYLAQVTQKLVEHHFNITNLNARNNKDKTFTITLSVEIKDINQIEGLLALFRSIKGTVDVYRVKK